MDIPAKRDLPVPYNKDLSEVLRNLNRHTEHARLELANNPTTAAYLHAGMRLIERHLGPHPERRPVRVDDETSLDRRVLSFLSQREVVAEVRRNGKPFATRGEPGVLRTTWGPHSNYIADLLRFGLWSAHYEASYDRSMRERGQWIVEKPDLVETVHRAALEELDALVAMPIFRLHLLAVATGEGDDVVREAIAENYRGLLDDWRDTYERAFTARGLKLRPGVSFGDLTQVLAALAEGMALRDLGDAQARIRTSADRSLFGTGVVAVLLSFLQPAGEPGDTMEDRLRAVAPPPSTGRDARGHAPDLQTSA
jgi:hypothetical protein